MKVSCVIPVHNGERFLEDALKSVLRQNWPELEILVADDASTDSTREVVRQVSLTDSRIKLLELPKLGQYETRNRGLEAAEGDIIGFLDADDLWSFDRLQIELEFFREHPEVDYIVANCEPFFDWLPDIPESIRARLEADPRNSRVAPIFTAAGLIARRSAFEKVGTFNPERGSACGMDWFLRARDLGLNERVLTHISYRRRLHGENYSLEISGQSYQNFAEALHQRIRRQRKQSGTS